MIYFFTYGTKIFERPRDNGRICLWNCKRCGQENEMIEFEIRKWFTLWHTPLFPLGGWKTNYFKCFYCNFFNYLSELTVEGLEWVKKNISKVKNQ